jgi:hypothetical protein
MYSFKGRLVLSYIFFTSSQLAKTNHWPCYCTVEKQKKPLHFTNYLQAKKNKNQKTLYKHLFPLP